MNFTVGAGSIDAIAPMLDAYIRCPVFLDADRHPDILLSRTEVHALDDHIALGVTPRHSFMGVVYRRRGEHPGGRAGGCSMSAAPLRWSRRRRLIHWLVPVLPLVVGDDIRLAAQTTHAPARPVHAAFVPSAPMKRSSGG